MSTLKTFLHLPGDQKKMVFEACFYAGKYRWLLLHRPFSRFADKLGQPGEEAYELPEEQVQTVLAVRKIVNMVCSRTPWKSECLVRAFTARRMLCRRQIHGNVYMGVRKDDSGKLLAHAWMKCGTVFVTGQKGHEAFTVTGVFHL